MKKVAVLLIVNFILLTTISCQSSIEKPYNFNDNVVVTENFSSDNSILDESSDVEHGELDDWIGEYRYLEWGGYVTTPEDPIDHHSIFYNAKIYKIDDDYFAEVTIGGWMVGMFVIAEVKGDAGEVEFIFLNYLPDGATVYKNLEKGDVLFKFIKHETEIYTEWGKIEPLLFPLENPEDRMGVYFERFEPEEKSIEYAENFHTDFFNSILQREDLTNWQKAYAEYLGDLVFDDLLCIYVKDLNLDGIPEVIYKVGAPGIDTFILSYNSYQDELELTELYGVQPYFLSQTNQLMISALIAQCHEYYFYDITEMGYEHESTSSGFGDKYIVRDNEATEDEFLAHVQEIQAMDRESLALTNDEIDFYEYLRENLFY